MSECVTKYGKISNNQVGNTITNIKTFCALLRDNQVKNSKEEFLKLPFVVQCLFLYHSWSIIKKKSDYSDDSYLTAFRLFKLFRSKEFKAKPIYAKYLKLKSLEKYYKKALDWNRSYSPAKSSSKSPAKSSSKSPAKSSSKSPAKTAKSTAKYEKEFQRRPEPESETDPLYIFYTTLYKQKSNSPLAITWLTEHGVLEGEERKTLAKQYKKLAEKGQLIK